MNSGACPGLRQNHAGSRTSGRSNIRSGKMVQEYNITGMVVKIKALRQQAEELKEISGGIPTVEKNVNRILANVKMLEINVVDRWQIS